MISSLKDNGRAAIISSQGILFRGKEEKNIRKKFIEADILEGIVALPQDLFHGAEIPACILIINKNKSKERKNKVIVIYASRDFAKGKIRNTLREEDINKITSAFKHYHYIEGYCNVIDLEEIRLNHYNLNILRYIDLKDIEEGIDIQNILDKLKILEKETIQIDSLLENELLNLGFEKSL